MCLKMIINCGVCSLLRIGKFRFVMQSALPRVHRTRWKQHHATAWPIANALVRSYVWISLIVDHGLKYLRNCLSLFKASRHRPPDYIFVSALFHPDRLLGNGPFVNFLFLHFDRSPFEWKEKHPHLLSVNREYRKAPFWTHCCSHW